MSWIATQAGGRPVSPADLPAPLRRVLSFVDTWPAVLSNTVQCYETEHADGKYVFCFQFRWDRPARVVDSRIQRPEQVALWFRVDTPLDSAPQVRADRDGFPLDIPHLNPVRPGEPAWLCLAREGLDSIFARKGIRGVLERLNCWLRDAAAGSLEHDGWEPTPRLRALTATLDINAFQRISLSSKRDRAGIARGFAFAILDEDKQEEKEIHFQLIAKEKQVNDLWDKAQLDAISSSKRRRTLVTRWFSVWGPRIRSVTRRFGEIVMDRDSLLRYAETAGCKSLVEQVLFLNLKRADAGGLPAFVLLIGAWRPQALIRSIPGLAEDDAARLELAGFSIWLKKQEGHGHQLDSISELRLLSEANIRSLNHFAGYSTLPETTVLIGAGALGSKMAEHMVREGAPSLKIVDNDRLAPHNLARHSLAADSVHFPKATELRERLLTINPYCDIEAFRKNFAHVPVGSLRKEICGNAKGVLIDATADVSVMRRICNEDNVMRVVKVELAHGGLLGLLYYEGKGRSPRIDDLRAVVPALGQEIFEDMPEIAEWLSGGESFRLDTGIGCASSSMQMSDSRVALHAAQFMASVGGIMRFEDHPSGIGVGVLDKSGHFRRWQWIAEPAPVVMAANDRGESWSVRIRNRVLQVIDGARDATTPIETGGYLYGTIDLSLRTIYVTAAVPVQVEASTFRVRLPGAGKSAEELELRKFSGEQLRALGTWHTHPSGSSLPSLVDIQQFKNDASAYAKVPAPHVMVIRADTGLSVALAVPESWQGDEKT